MRQLTKSELPNEIVETTHGNMFWEMWLYEEQKRLNRDIPNYAFIRKYSNGRSHIMINAKLAVKKENLIFPFLATIDPKVYERRSM